MEDIAENIIPEEFPFSMSNNWLIIICLLVLSLGGVWAYNRYSSSAQVINHGQDDPKNINYCDGDKCYL